MVSHMWYAFKNVYSFNVWKLHVSDVKYILNLLTNNRKLIKWWKKLNAEDSLLIKFWKADADCGLQVWNSC